ncbi:MAG: prolyl oligopeptidase family serine peptidase [Actinomycetota bacterium]
MTGPFVTSGPGSGDSYPRQSARTRQFRLGAPRSFTVADDGRRVVFLRSSAGDDPVNALWVLDVATGAERLVADPRALVGTGPESLPPEERARRERAREASGGIVAYDTDSPCREAVFALDGRLFLAALDRDGGDGDAARVAAQPGGHAVSGSGGGGGAGGMGRRVATLGGEGEGEGEGEAVEDGPRGPRGRGSGVTEVAARPGVYDPRLAPGGGHVAYVTGDTLRVVDRGGSERLVLAPEGPEVSWGSADFVAAEEMGRTRGHWWSPDGRRLAVARVDVSPVQSWYIADPAEPASPPLTVRYPAAGTANAVVGLWLVDLDGGRTEVAWDAAAKPYLVAVRWGPEGLLVTVQSRDQRTLDVLAVDPATGQTSLLARQSDPAWVEIVPGTPAWAPGGRLVTTVDGEGSRRLALDGEAVTPPGLQVRRVAHSGPAGVLFTASAADPTEVDVYRLGPGGAPERLTGGGGVGDVAAAAGDVAVLSWASPAEPGAQAQVWQGDVALHAVASLAEVPAVRPRPLFTTAGPRAVHAAVLLPAEGSPGAAALAQGPLPVLLDPYGGPHAQRVLRAHNAFLGPQWLADQGFAVVVVDGRGTPGRGPQWEREVLGDLAGPVLDDQVDALADLARRDERLDLSRVAVRGWSFGGYLAALAVIRRPDVFHAAIAGAPVTDWALYDTHYTERYLGTPQSDPDAYRRCSLVAAAAGLRRPLLLVHGLADDNVVAAHTLRLSRALLESGRPHQVLPLSGVTHMTPQEVVAENLLLLQVAFLKEALGPG